MPWNQILFLGDDAGGSTKPCAGACKLDGVRYVLPKLILQGTWWLLWLVIALHIGTRMRDGRYLSTPGLAIAAIPFLYFWTLHSVIESSGKYDVPVLGFLAIVVGILIDRASTTNRRSAVPSTCVVAADALHDRRHA